MVAGKFIEISENEPIRIEFTELYEKHYFDLLTYSLENYSAVSTVKLVREIQKSISTLSLFPNMYKINRFLKSTAKFTYREIAINPYNIIYCVEKNVVTMLAIVHQKRNPKIYKKLIK